MTLEQRICALTGAHVARRKVRLQRLWRGYGEVVRFELEGAQHRSVVVKAVEPPVDAHPRKLRSYAVEAEWYRAYSGRCGARTRVPEALGTWSNGRSSIFVLEDLHGAGFDTPLHPLDTGRCRLALDWLARFHATFLGYSPDGLWRVGTYWHLETRPAELRAMSDKRLAELAPELDRLLNSARFQTFVHGDAKPSNFLIHGQQGAIAAVDFQYVGGGVGIKDVVYLLGESLPQHRRDALVDHYFSTLRSALPSRWEAHADAIELEWRRLLPTAQLDFARFRDGWGV